jgi:glycosyltransferase involved in cell wall biosynthesis
LNILFLSELFYPHGSGGELATYLYSQLLSKSGFNVTVVTNRFGGEPEISRNENLTVYRLPLFNKNKADKYSLLQRVDVLISGFMRKMIKWADVVYIPKFWFLAIPFAKAYGKPVIVHLHGYIPICPVAVLYSLKDSKICSKEKFCSPKCIYAYESRRSVYRAFGSTFLNLCIWPSLRRFIELSDTVICVSRAQKDIIIKYVPSLMDRVKVIYNPMPLLSPLEINGDDFGYFGGPNFLKGFHVLLNALRYRKCKGFKSVIIRATKFSKKYKCYTDWLTDLGFITYKKLDSYEYDRVYRKIRAVVVPSIWHEPLPYVVAETILRGRIVIASHVGGIPELVDGCKGVFLFQPSNYIELAKLMEHVSGLSMETTVDLGYKNKEAFMKKFDNNRIVKEFIDTIILNKI